MTPGRQPPIEGAISITAAAVLLAVGLATAQHAAAGPPAYLLVPDSISGTSWNNLGQWHIDYQRISGGDPAVAETINSGITALANDQATNIQWRPSTSHPWTYDATGTTRAGLETISALYVGRYNTDLPNMPFQTVATAVFNAHDGTTISWGTLFQDKNIGLTRLSEQAKQLLPAAYPDVRPELINANSTLAPMDINYRSWLPTTAGIELHFADYQFGRGLKTITVPWPRVADLLQPQFASLER
jgi:hypothetical protein